jgi:hypothetical protein
MRSTRALSKSPSEEFRLLLNGLQRGAFANNGTGAQANALSFTGGTNALTLSTNIAGTTMTGTITRNIAVGSSLAINSGTAAGTAAKLGSTITIATVITRDQDGKPRRTTNRNS